MSVANGRDDLWDPDFSEISPRERIFLLVGVVIAVTIVLWALFLGDWFSSITEWGIWEGDFVPGDDWSWETNRTVYLTLLLIGALLIWISGNVYFSTDEAGGEEDQLGGGTIAGVSVAIIIGILLVNSNIPFLGYWADTTMAPECTDPRYPILYDEVQPYGAGNCGPENEGLLSDGEGAAVGCVGGAGLGAGIAAWGAIPTGGLSIPFGAALGCAFGAAGGYGFSSADFDGDPTTGW